MPESQFEIRPADRQDAAHLARFINMAGEGLPHYLWARMAGDGEDAWSVGAQRARREEGGFSYRNGFLAELDGEVAACLIGYALPPEPEPFDAAALPPIFVPL